MSDLAPQFGDAFGVVRRGEHGRISRDVVRALRDEQAAGLLRAARVDARAHVARVALMNTALLSADEAALITASPLAEPRMKAIVDMYAMFAAGEVGRL